MPRSFSPRLNALMALLAATLGPVSLIQPSQAQPANSPPAARIPVIFDTDIGDDIDDTWALGLLLKSPELDLRLVLGDHGKSLYRARLLAKFLERAGRTDVPVGVGLDVNVRGDGAQAAWVKDYNLNRYPGRVYPDGVQALIDLIMQSPVPITVIAVGPLPNLAAALEREPAIAQRARFVGMHGSVRVGYGGSKTIAAEYNVKEDAKACQETLSAAWDVTITPLDTCGLIDLSGTYYRAVRDADDPIAKAILENYRIWNHRPHDPNWKLEVNERSSTLFDTVAVYLAFAQDLVTIENLAITVTPDGFTRLDPKGKTMKVATAWRNLEGFRALLADRLVGSKPGGH